MRNLKFPINKSAVSCPSVQWQPSRPQSTWVASGEAPEREARPLTTMTHSVFRWWTVKSKASPPFKPYLKWGSLFVSSWKNILWVGGWIRTVTNCCRYGVKHLEVRGAGSKRALWNFTRSTLCKRLSWHRTEGKSHTARHTEREERGRRAAGEGTVARLHCSGGGKCCLWGEKLRGVKAWDVWCLELCPDCMTLPLLRPLIQFSVCHCWTFSLSVSVQHVSHTPRLSVIGWFDVGLLKGGASFPLTQ